MNIIKNNDLEQLYENISKKMISAIKSIDNDLIILGLCGGRSVAGVLQCLNKNEDVDWSKVHIFLIDERCVETTHPESNYKLIKENFNKGHLHPFVIDKNKSDFGINEYQKEFEKFGNKFDIILLSMGEDGHVGALYPHLSILNEDAKYFYLDNSPKPPSQRTTSSKKQMLTAQYAMLMIFGDSKCESYKKFLDANMGVEDCPAKLVNSISDCNVYTNL